MSRDLPGSKFWGVVLPNGTFRYFFADYMDVEYGALRLWRVSKNGESETLMAFSPGAWSYGFAASNNGGKAIAIEKFDDVLDMASEERDADKKSTNNDK